MTSSGDTRLSRRLGQASNGATGSDSGSKVLKPRSIFTGAFESSISSNNTNNIVENKPKGGSNENKQNYNNLNINIPTSSIKANKPQKIKVFNSQGGVQVVENKQLAHGGIRVLEKQLHTVPKSFSFESRKLCAQEPQVY